jgi:hypothetical protein
MRGEGGWNHDDRASGRPSPITIINRPKILHQIHIITFGPSPKGGASPPAMAHIGGREVITFISTTNSADQAVAY